MTVEKEIKELGELLKNRLEPDLVDDSLRYIDQSEVVLGFETLCDHIGDYDIKLSANEYQKVLAIVKSLGLRIGKRYTYINPNKA